MGLDMYLSGERYLHGKRKKRGKFEVKSEQIALGYWRKHPNLHGYIVNTFADGEDECQEIRLGKEDIENIIEAVKEKRLPVTSGFFFGASDGSEIKGDLKILKDALKWLNTPEEGVWKSVIYQASW